MAHYGISLKTEELVAWANTAATELGLYLKDIPPEYTPLLCYRGMSGVAHATALAIELTRRGKKFFHCYVRKPDECSHGESVECNTDNKVVLVFVDDFTFTGWTQEVTLKTALTFTPDYYSKKPDIYQERFIGLYSEITESGIKNLSPYINV